MRSVATALLFVCGVVAFAKEKPRVTIQVLGSEASQRQYTRTIPGRKGTSQTNCTTTGTSNGTINDYGVGPIQTNSNSSADTNCTTTTTAATPPQTVTRYITQEHVNAVMPDGRQVVLWCQEGFRRCDSLQPGEYQAEIDGNAIWVIIHELSGKERKVKYKAVSVQEASLGEQPQAAVTPPTPSTMNVAPVPPTESIENAKGQTATESPKTQFELGRMYEFGRGVPKDYAQAMLWYRKSADQGYAIAEFRLGILYANGLGVPRDESQAVSWYQKAAEHGNVDAQELIGLGYFTGRGVPPDGAKAYFWLDIASMGNVPEAVPGQRTTERDMAAAVLSPTDRARVQEQVREWLNAHAVEPR